MIELFLGFLGLGGSLAAAVYSLFGLLARERAEKKLVKRLTSDRDCRRYFQARLRGTITEASLDEIEKKYIYEALARLEEDDRQRVAEGLQQPSLSGRHKYLAKLVLEAKEALAEED